MEDVKIKNNPVLGFILWLVWVSVATVILGGAIYLFVGGSTLFSQYNTAPLVIYKEVSSTDAVLLTGSILLPSACHQLQVSNNGNEIAQELRFVFNKVDNCKMSSVNLGGVPETFFVQFDGDENTEITARVDNVKRELIIK